MRGFSVALATAKSAFRGFKTWANKIADDVRGEIGLRPLERLDPRVLAKSLGISIIELSNLRKDAPAVVHLLDVEREVFSAMTVFSGPTRTIVHNNGHTAGRQNSNLCHELSHGLLGHSPAPALDEKGCRIWDQDVEDEAAWLAGCLLITESAAIAIARGQWTTGSAAEHFGVRPTYGRLST